MAETHFGYAPTSLIFRRRSRIRGVLLRVVLRLLCCLQFLDLLCQRLDSLRCDPARVRGRTWWTWRAGGANPLGLNALGLNTLNALRNWWANHLSLNERPGNSLQRTRPDTHWYTHRNPRYPHRDTRESLRLSCLRPGDSDRCLGCFSKRDQLDPRNRNLNRRHGKREMRLLFRADCRVAHSANPERDSTGHAHRLNPKWLCSKSKGTLWHPHYSLWTTGHSLWETRYSLRRTGHPLWRAGHILAIFRWTGRRLDDHPLLRGVNHNLFVPGRTAICWWALCPSI